ncbi:MAG TPA: hypothetical protein VIN11_07165 [Roseivirga sp.]
MKRSLTILFTALYLITSSGVLFGQHICMGRVKDSALFKKVEKQCGMSMDSHQDMDGCCDDQWQLEIIDDEQQSTSFQHAPLTAYHLLYEVPFAEMVSIVLNQKDEVELKNTGPPDVIHPDLYLFYHNLKIPSGLQS